MNMNRASLFDVESGESSVTPEAIADALHHIINDVRTYLSDWCYRLEQNVKSQGVSATSEAVLHERIDEFQKMKTLWEAKRVAEEQQIKQKTDQLTEAWLRLEDEQRSFLQHKETQGGGRQAAADQPQVPSEVDCSVGRRMGHAGQPAIAASAAPMQPAAVQQHTHLMQPAAAHGVPQVAVEPHATVPAASGPTSRTRESAVVQFQRMRKEIESSRTTAGR